MGIISEYEAGLWTYRIKDSRRMVLVVKCQKEMILSARERGGFTFFIHYFKLDWFNTFGITTAFFDDPQNPLVITTPVCSGGMATELTELINSKGFDVHFYDLHSRELLAYSCTVNPKIGRLRRMKKCEFFQASMEKSVEVIDILRNEFSNNWRNADRVFVKFRNKLIPENICYITLDNVGSMGVSNSVTGVNSYKLHQENPGQYQEYDIAKWINRHINEANILINPMRVDNNEEFSDVVAAVGDTLICVQAKDSPNTPASIKRSLDRKISTVSKHISKAMSQVRGSNKYANKTDEIELSTTDGNHSIRNIGIKFIHLIIVKELFSNHYIDMSNDVLSLANDINSIVILMEYREFANLCFTATSGHEMVFLLTEVFNRAVEFGAFSPIQFLRKKT